MDDMDRLGKYQIVARIGTGGFGVVYKAVDPFIKRTVAIKTCSAEDPEMRQRFLLEAEICGNLHHRNIVTIYDFGYEQETPYLVQEYLSGEDLDQKIKRRDYLPMPERILWLVQIARGLAYAHARGIVHRDIKPSNIRILEDGTAKILDFGIAKLAQAASTLTQAGITLGTAAYLAPEQIRSEPIDTRTDVFAFGTLAYELLTFQRPFQAHEIPAILYKILHVEPTPLLSMAPDCPAELAQIVHRCLSKNPAQRFAPTEQLVAALERVARAGNRVPVDSLVTSRTELVQPVQVEVPPPPVPASKPAPLRVDRDTSPTARIGVHEVELLTPQASPPLPRSAGLTTVAFRRGTGWGKALRVGGGIAAVALVAALATYWLVRPPSLATASDPEAGSPDLRAGSPVGSQPANSPLPAAPAPAGQAPGAAGAPAAGPTGPSVEAPGADAEPTPEPTPEPARVRVGPAWGPGLSVWIAGREFVLDRERIVELEPGTHSVRFRLQAPDYSFEERVRLTVEAGRTHRLEIPIQPPGKLTVQAHLETPPGTVRLNGQELGSSPIRGKWLLPGTYSLEVLPLSPSVERPPLAQSLAVASQQETIVTFDLEGREPILIRQKPLVAGNPN